MEEAQHGRPPLGVAQGVPRALPYYTTSISFTTEEPEVWYHRSFAGQASLPKTIHSAALECVGESVGEGDDEKTCPRGYHRASLNGNTNERPLPL